MENLSLERNLKRMAKGEARAILEAVKVIHELTDNRETIKDALNRIQDALDRKTNPRK